MSFDANKEGLLGKLNSMQKQKTRAQANRAVRAKLHAKDREKELSADKESVKELAQETTEKPTVLLYGVVRLFQGTMKSILAPYCDVVEFNDAEQATDYIFENKVPFVILDMDPPNDWKMCHDLFTTGKTMYPDMVYFVFHKEASVADEIAVLEAQGARIMNKPVDQMLLIQSINEVIKRNASK